MKVSQLDSEEVSCAVLGGEGGSEVWTLYEFILDYDVKGLRIDHRHLIYGFII